MLKSVPKYFRICSRDFRNPSKKSRMQNFRWKKSRVQKIPDAKIPGANKIPDAKIPDAKKIAEKNPGCTPVHPGFFPGYIQPCVRLTFCRQ